MTSRGTPPVMPTFGDPSGNHPYTMYFDNVKGEGVYEEPQSKTGKKFVSKKPSNQYAKTTANPSSDDDERFNDKSGKKSTPSRYQGRLGNRLSSYPQKPAGNTVQPNTYENRAKVMEFGAWKENPEVPITVVFENVKREKEAGLSLHSPALHSDGGRQGTPSHNKKISKNDHKKSSWFSRFNPKKWWKRLFGSC